MADINWEVIRSTLVTNLPCSYSVTLVYSSALDYHLPVIMSEIHVNIKEEIASILQSITNQLDKCVQFWLDHSIDLEYGWVKSYCTQWTCSTRHFSTLGVLMITLLFFRGYFNCLARDGTVYDETKYGWLQGRQVWMLATLYNEVERFHTSQVLNAAIHGNFAQL